MFDPNTAKPVNTGFDPSTAVELTPVSEDTSDQVSRTASRIPASPYKIEQEPEGVFKEKFKRYKEESKPLGWTKDTDSPLAGLGAAADVVSGIVSMPYSYVKAFHEANSQLIRGEGLPSMDTINKGIHKDRQDMSPRGLLRNILTTFFDADQETVDNTLYDDNIVDRLMSKIDDGLNAVSRKVGIPKESLGETVFKDVVMTAVPLALGKSARGIKAEQKPKSAVDSFNEIKAKQVLEESPTGKPTEGVQGELFGEKQKGMWQQELPFEQIDKFLDETSVEPVYRDPRQMELPLEEQRGTTPDMFAPANLPKDVDTTGVRNPYEPTLREQATGRMYSKSELESPAPYKPLGQIKKGQSGVIDKDLLTLGVGRLLETMSPMEVLRKFKGTFHEKVIEREIKASMDPSSPYHLVWMSPDEFHRLAANRKGREKEPSADYKREDIEKGLTAKEGLASIPILAIKGDKIVNHDGRHRADKFIEKGLDKIPVLIEKVDKSPWPEKVFSEDALFEEFAQSVPFPQPIFQKAPTQLYSFGGWWSEKKQPKIFASSPEWRKAKIDQMISPYNKFSDLVSDQASLMAKPERDIGVIGGLPFKVSTKNQGKNIVNSPAITYFVSEVKQSYQHEAQILAKVMQTREAFDKLSKDDALAVLAVATKLNRDRSIQEAGKKSGVAEAPDAQLRELGLTDKQIEGYRAVRETNEILKNVVVSHRRELDGTDMETPIWAYHPLSHGIGENGLVFFDKKTKKLLYAHRFPTYKELVEAVEPLKKAINEDGNNIEMDYRAKMKTWENPYADMTPSTMPAVVQKIIDGIQEKVETRKREFELKRAYGEVGGVIEFLKDGAPDPELLNVWNRYQKNVLTFAKNTKVFGLNKEFMEQHAYFGDKPNTANFIKLMLAKELGGDVATRPFKWMEQALLTVLNEVEKGKFKEQGIELLGEDDFVISNNAITTGSKFAASTASSAVLLLNSNNAILNATQMPLTGIAGLPLDMIGRLGFNADSTIKFTAKTNVAFSKALGEILYTKTTGKPTNASKILDKYNKMGEIRAHMFDEIVDLSESFVNPGEKAVAKVLNKTKHWTNDLFIEQPTNATALLYYDLLINKVAKDHFKDLGLTKRQLEQLPIELAKSWVGEYQKFAKPQYIDQMGFVGNLTGNFANWSHNQLGRLMEAVGQLKPESGKGLAQSAGFLVAMYGIYAAIAGIQNSPGFSTWETIRQWINKTKDKEEDEIPPLNYYLKEWGLPTGSLLDFTGLDMSSGQRFADLVHINTLTPEFFYGLYKMAKLFYKEFTPQTEWESLQNTPEGVTRREYLESSTKAPPLIKQSFISKHATFPYGDEGANVVVNKFDNPAYYQLDETEKWLNRLGLKTVRQRNEQEKIQANRITERNAENDPKKLKEAILQQLTSYSLSEEDSFATEATIISNMIKLKRLNPEFADTFAEDFIERVRKMQQTPEEAVATDITKTKNIGKLSRLIKQMERLGLYD